MIADVRRLIYGLRPPALDQLGLAASLRGLACAGVLPDDVVHDRRSDLGARALPRPSKSRPTGSRRKR